MTFQEKYTFLETALVQLAEANSASRDLPRRRPVISAHAAESIRQRKEARASRDRRAVTTLSKQLYREIRRQSRSIADEKIKKILNEQRGIRHIAGIHSNAKRTMIPQIRDIHGSLCTSRQDIADDFNVFFYKFV